jgi:hypothetical protein
VACLARSAGLMGDVATYPATATQQRAADSLFRRGWDAAFESRRRYTPRTIHDAKTTRAPLIDVSSVTKSQVSSSVASNCADEFGTPKDKRAQRREINPLRSLLCRPT